MVPACAIAVLRTTCPTKTVRMPASIATREWTFDCHPGKKSDVTMVSKKATECAIRYCAPFVSRNEEIFASGVL